MTYPPPQSPYGAPPPQQQPPGGPVAQKSKATPVILIVLGIVLLICLGCAGFGAYSLWWAKDKAQEIVDSIPTDFPTDFPSFAPGAAGTTHTIRYEVSGSGLVRVGWSERSVGQGSAEVNLPWSKEFTLTEPNFGAQVFAVPKDKDASVETCKIFIDGVERKSGKFANNTLICSFVFVSK